MDLKQYIREVKDFPKPGIDFKDITPLIQNPGAFRTCIDQFVSLTRDADVIMGLDAR
jgi:adenine phosphoribosyltransferase